MGGGGGTSGAASFMSNAAFYVCFGHEQKVEFHATFTRFVKSGVRNLLDRFLRWSRLAGGNSSAACFQ